MTQKKIDQGGKSSKDPDQGTENVGLYVGTTIVQDLGGDSF